MPCPYPKISQSLNIQNITAWDIWTTHADSLINGLPHMAGVTYTLNLDFLKFLFENMDLGDKMIFYRKIKTIFDAWNVQQDKQDNPKTKEAMNRTKSMQRAG